MPTQVPDFQPVIRSWIAEDDNGELVLVQVRQCRHSGARIKTTTRLAPTSPTPSTRS